MVDSESVSSLQQEQNRLRQELKLVKAIVDNCTAVIYLKDPDGRYLFVNKLFESLFHLDREKILGRTDTQIFGDEFGRRFRENDVKVLEARKPMEWEEVAPHDDGPHDYLSLKFPLFDQAGKLTGLCGISSDITARRRAEQELDRFFNLSLDLLCIADFNGFFVRINPSWTATLGWSLEELQARPYLDFVHAEDRAATVAEAEKLAIGDITVSFENRYMCKDGSYKWLMWNATPLAHQNLIYAAARDVTLHKLAEQEKAEAARNLRQALDKAKQLAHELELSVASEREAHQQLKTAQSQLVQSEKMFALGQLVAGVAHEINNPLAAGLTNLAVLDRDVGGLLQLVRQFREAERSLPAQAREAFQTVQDFMVEIDAEYVLDNLPGLIHRMHDGLKRIQAIVHNLREFARVGGLEIHEVDINTGIETTIELLRLQAQAKNLTIEFRPSPLPGLSCQPAKIYQVVANLVGNAIDACSAGDTIEVWTNVRDRWAEIHVKDSGPGMTPEVRKHIFNPFFTTKSPGKGTGLGLSISHSIVSEHRGEIKVETAAGQGCHFTVSLPL